MCIIYPPLLWINANENVIWWNIAFFGRYHQGGVIYDDKRERFNWADLR